MSEHLGGSCLRAALGLVPFVPLPSKLLQVVKGVRTIATLKWKYLHTLWQTIFLGKKVGHPKSVSKLSPGFASFQFGATAALPLQEVQLLIVASARVDPFLVFLSHAERDIMRNKLSPRVLSSIFQSCLWLLNCQYIN